MEEGNSFSNTADFTFSHILLEMSFQAGLLFFFSK